MRLSRIAFSQERVGLISNWGGGSGPSGGHGGTLWLPVHVPAFLATLDISFYERWQDFSRISPGCRINVARRLNVNRIREARRWRLAVAYSARGYSWNILSGFEIYIVNGPASSRRVRFPRPAKNERREKNDQDGRADNERNNFGYSVLKLAVVERTGHANARKVESLHGKFRLSRDDGSRCFMQICVLCENKPSTNWVKQTNIHRLIIDLRNSITTVTRIHSARRGVVKTVAPYIR